MITSHPGNEIVSHAAAHSSRAANGSGHTSVGSGHTNRQSSLRSYRGADLLQQKTDPAVLAGNSVNIMNRIRKDKQPFGIPAFSQNDHEEKFTQVPIMRSSGDSIPEKINQDNSNEHNLAASNSGHEVIQRSGQSLPPFAPASHRAVRNAAGTLPANSGPTELLQLKEEESQEDRSEKSFQQNAAAPPDDGIHRMSAGENAAGRIQNNDQSFPSISLQRTGTDPGPMLALDALPEVDSRGEMKPFAESGEQAVTPGRTFHTIPAALIQRDEDDQVTEGEEGSEGEELRLTRPQEIELSRSSPGEYTGEPQPLTLSFFNYGIDIAQPKPEHLAVLQELIHLLNITATVPIIVRVIGFADSTGGDRHNLALSRRRADAVKAIIEPSITQRVTVTARGEANPATTNESVSGRSRNRRVDLRFPTDRPPTPQPLPRPAPVPPGQQPPEPVPHGQQPPGPVPVPVPPGTPLPPVPRLPGGGGSDEDTSFCEDHPLLCAIGIPVFMAPLICIAAPELCTCILAPELCLIPPVLPPPPPPPPEQPPGDGDDDDDDRQPIVQFVPSVRAANTPAGMNDRIGLRDPVSVTAVVINPPPVTSPLTITVDGTGLNAGEATINGAAQIQITGTTPLTIQGTTMSSDSFALNPYLQLAAWSSTDLVGQSNRFAVSSIAENWSAIFDGGNTGRFGYVFKADMKWQSDSGSYNHLDACQYVELVGVVDQSGGMADMGTGQVNDPNDADTCEFPPAFDEHGTPFENTRTTGFSHLKQLWRIRDMRSNSGWAPSKNSGFEIIRHVKRDPDNPRCWHLVVTKRGASVDIGGMHSDAGAGDISHNFQNINCDPPPPPPPPQDDPPQIDPVPPQPQQDPGPLPPSQPCRQVPCNRPELAVRVDECVEEARQATIDCSLEALLSPGVLGGIEYLACLDDVKTNLLECDQRAKEDTNCPDHGVVFECDPDAEVA